VLCMEYMDCGSLDRISKDFGPVRVDVLGKITENILGGLVYLYEAHRIMHRDIKPSNVLVNSRGMIKLCDFGVATETVNSVANTFVGTSTYMAPERIQGGAYSIKSDVWSVGLTIMELAIGRFPFDSNDSAAGDRQEKGPMGILDLLQTIVHEPAPKLPKSEAFPAILDDFIAKCLLKNPAERPTPRELYDKDNFLQAAKRTPVDLQEWAVSMMNQHNRKSYLLPPAPPSLNRDGSYSATAGTSNNSRTPSASTTGSAKIASPTTGEIPMMAIQSPQRFGQILTAPSSQSATPTGIAQRSPPPPLSLQHLSLETEEMPANGQYPRTNRLGFSSRDNIPEPASAIESSGRPLFPPRTSSSSMLQSNASNMNARLPIQSAGLPARAPPPTGPLPPPPNKALPTPPATGSMSAGFAPSPRRNR
jgi:mitogen-activated protein kinase kinase